MKKKRNVKREQNDAGLDSQHRNLKQINDEDEVLTQNGQDVNMKKKRRQGEGLVRGLDETELLSQGQDVKITKKTSQGEGEEGMDSQRQQNLKQDGDAAEDDDSDLPEVVTMTEGRQEAQNLRREQRESGRRIAAEAKKRRQQRASKKGDDETRLKTVATTPLQELPAEAAVEDKEVQQPQQGLNGGGLLDDSIVEFLSAREKAGVSPSDERHRATTLPTKANQKKPSRSKRENKANSRVQLVLLKDLSASLDQSAVEFKYDHLFGSRIKRDISMLKKVSKYSDH